MDYGTAAESGGFAALFAFFAAMMFFFVIVGILLYVLSSIGLYKLALNRGIENPWMAWIPVANFYIIGKLIQTLSIGTYVIPNVELVLTGGCLAALLLSWIPVIGMLLSLAFAVLTCFALFRLYTLYRPQQATLWLILSIVLPFMGPIFIFMLRKDPNPQL